MQNGLLLIDTHHHIYRAFHGITVFAGRSGEPVNAVHGFVRMLRKWMTELRPTHVAAVFDAGISAQRRAALPSYKGGRAPRPAEMEVQVPLIREILREMGILQVEVPGEEADDVIASLARVALEKGLDVLVASNDKDYAQLVGPHLRWVRAERSGTVVMDEPAVKARYGVVSGQVVDFMCLVGDKVDNIPGVPGVGEKTAAELLNRFGDVETLIARVNEIERPKMREAISGHAELIRGNRVLVALRQDIALPVTLDDLRPREMDGERLGELYRAHRLKSLLEDLERDSQQTPDLFGGF